MRRASGIDPAYSGPCSVITDADILRCARHMILHHGDGAASRAARRAIELRAAGEPIAADTWVRVKTAIEKLQSKNPGPGETVQ
jgi:hypothetical protein